ncbi:Invasin [Edwardsiella tarda]|nr:Invasin [Edwardsiella tarda]
MLTGDTLLAAGGQINAVDKTHFSLTLPPYRQQSRAANGDGADNVYYLYAVAFDDKGNQSDDVSLIVKVQPPQAALEGTPIVDGNGAIANGHDAIGVTFTVKDSSGTPVADQEVNITADNNAQPPQMTVKTNAAGEARIELTNTRAGTTTVTAALNGASKSQKVEFVADHTTAHFDGTPTITHDNAPADGASKITLAFKVIDANGNPIDGEDVGFTTDNGAQPALITIKTNSQGIALLDVTNTTVGPVTINARVASDNQSYQVNFVADRTSAQIAGSPTIINNNALANGRDKIDITVVIEDANGNLIPGYLVKFDADNGATPASMSVKTDEHGQAQFAVTNTQAGTTSLLVTLLNGKTQIFDANFIADPNTASFVGTPTVTNNGAPADGVSKIGVGFTLKDANANPIVAKDVKINTTNSATPSTLTVKTNAQGVAQIELTNNTLGTTVVTAEFNGKSQSQDVTFMADSSSAQFDGSPVVTNDNALANGTAQISVAFKVKDGSNHPLANQDVVITTTNGAAPATMTVKTDAAGVARLDLTNTSAGTSTVTATINGKTQSQDVTFIADTSTARFEGMPTVTNDNAPANGTSEIGVAFTLKDAQGNPIINQDVTLSATSGATPVAASVKTDDKGIAKFALTSTKAGTSSVTATYNGKSQSQDVIFIADVSTAKFTGTPQVSNDNALANGTAQITVVFSLQDANNNPIANQDISVSASNSASPANTTLKTDVQGKVSVQLTNSTPGTTKVTASFNGQSQSQDVTFVQPIAVRQNIFNRVLSLNDAIAIAPITITGGLNPVVSVSPALPTGLNLDASTGAISGTPTALTGETSYTISVKDATSAPATTVTLVLSVVTGPTVTVAIADKTLTQNASVTARSYIQSREPRL